MPPFDIGSRSLNQEDAMVAALLALHRRKQQEQRASEPGSGYARILEHFEQRGERLRGERLVTGELIERLFQGAKTLPVRRVQQELEIVGSPGGLAAGRVRITNRTAERARYDLVVGEPVEGAECPPIVFDFPSDEVQPGESRLVRVEASLVGWREGMSATIPVECRWNCGYDRLWLVVSTHSSHR